jgi:MFS transporter, PAT family, beta-lactamase induction signal transducer AmpG
MATAAIGERPKGLKLLGTAMKSRKTAIMLVFGFAAGLPYTLLIGTLNAWLGEWQIDLATIGVISWIGLAYAFKFLWSPLVDRVRLPVLERLGRRRSWLVLCQVLLTGTSSGLRFRTRAGARLVCAGRGDRRLRVCHPGRGDRRLADRRRGRAAPVEILSSIYQFGYRIAALIGGALALVLSERVSWPTVYAIMGGFMALTLIATALAPDTPRTAIEREQTALRRTGAIDPKLRAIGLAIVGAAGPGRSGPSGASWSRW